MIGFPIFANRNRGRFGFIRLLSSPVSREMSLWRSERGEGGEGGSLAAIVPGFLANCASFKRYPRRRVHISGRALITVSKHGHGGGLCSNLECCSLFSRRKEKEGLAFK